MAEDAVCSARPPQADVRGGPPATESHALIASDDNLETADHDALPSTADGVEAVTLAELRHRARLSQRELGERLNRQQTAIARMERRENPTVNTLRQFVSSLGGELELTVKVPGRPPVKLMLPR